MSDDGRLIVSNEALASLILFATAKKPEGIDTVQNLITKKGKSQTNDCLRNGVRTVTQILFPLSSVRPPSLTRNW